MIRWFLIATGAFVWLWLVVAVALSVLKRNRVQRRLQTPGLFPYTMLVQYRFLGLLLGILRALGLLKKEKIKPELVEAFSSAQLSDLVPLRDVLLEMDQLPTIRRGLDALAIRSLFEVPTRNVPQMLSPYTHPQQRPAYYIPGLKARTFYDPAEFEWAQPLADAYPMIKAELLALVQQEGAGFKAYLTENNLRIGGWNTFNFFFYGKKFEENCARCPETTKLLESLPRFERDHVMFSALNPHAHIPPHTGPMNGIIRAHLPLIVPKGCWIRVGPDERTWEEGKLLVFDDSFEHEVWNHSQDVRIVLFINFWHPAFSAQEIEVLSRFRTAYERSPQGRVHEDNQAAARAHDLEMQKLKKAAAV
jgi:aspartyl/asparaginyl beta-hydroxylase (cupin superfamily)